MKCKSTVIPQKQKQIKEGKLWGKLSPAWRENHKPIQIVFMHNFALQSQNQSRARRIKLKHAAVPLLKIERSIQKRNTL